MDTVENRESLSVDLIWERYCRLQASAWLKTLGVRKTLCPGSNTFGTSAVSREVIETFLDPERYSWAQFDSELGYILGRYLPFDGIDGSFTISTAQENGARTARMYTDRPCRINTYGNSFTQCHQVSDGETWQEYLAAHLGEPIRNFGMGGYGVYQSYRRMLREEKTKLGAEYVLLYVWGDDHLRNLWRCRHAA